ncbi:MAG: hypothetical protein RR334_01620, partial [Clostridia bacterium]
RAPTPSIAGELAVFNINELDYNKKLLSQISKLSYNLLRAKQETILALEDIEDEFIDISNRLKVVIKNDVNNMIRQIDGKLHDRHISVDYSLIKLEKLNPISLLRRGFSQCYSNGLKVSKVDDVKIGDELKIMVTDGIISTEIKNMEKKFYEN